MSKRSSLLWRCRRGIREMDLLLQQFVEQDYDKLTSDEIRAFEQLLDEADLDILEWITGKSEPPSKALQELIEKIRSVNHIST